MKYKNTTSDISTDMLEGFFVDWPNPPSPKTHLIMLNKSS